MLPVQEAKGVPLAPWPSQATGSPPAEAATPASAAGGAAAAPAAAPEETSQPGRAGSATLPAHAAWFDFGAVHALEQPLLAGGSGTPPTPPLSEEVQPRADSFETCRLPSFISKSLYSLSFAGSDSSCGADVEREGSVLGSSSLWGCAPRRGSCTMLCLCPHTAPPAREGLHPRGACNQGL